MSGLLSSASGISYFDARHTCPDLRLPRIDCPTLVKGINGCQKRMLWSLTDIISVMATQTEDKYSLPRNAVEGFRFARYLLPPVFSAGRPCIRVTDACLRLDEQHRYLMDILGGLLVVDQSVNLGEIGRVLDAGSGTGNAVLSLSLFFLFHLQPVLQERGLSISQQK
jgi:hypothetical protein